MVKSTLPKGFNDLYSLLGEEEKKVFLFLKKNNFIKSLKFPSGKLSEQEDVVALFREKVISFLNELEVEVNKKLSSLLKEGKDVSLLLIEFESYSLKLRVFSETFSIEDMKRLIKIYKSVLTKTNFLS